MQPNLLVPLKSCTSRAYVTIAARGLMPAAGRPSRLHEKVLVLGHVTGLMSDRNCRC
jgi:hypothetical protein